MPDPVVLNVLRNADELLEALRLRPEATLSQLAADTGIPRSTVYRLVDALAAMRMVTVTPAGVSLSRRWLGLADAARAAKREWSQAREALRALVRDTGFTAYLSVRVGDEAMCIHWEQGQGINVLVLRPGRTLPFYAGAAGRCFLSTLEEEQLTDYLGRTQPVPFTDHTLVDADALRRDAERTRQRGYALSIEDVTVGAGAIGMLIQDDTRTSLGCVSLAGVASHISVQQEGLAAQLREALGVPSTSPDTLRDYLSNS